MPKVPEVQLGRDAGGHGGQSTKWWRAGSPLVQPSPTWAPGRSLGEGLANWAGRRGNGTRSPRGC